MRWPTSLPFFGPFQCLLYLRLYMGAKSNQLKICAPTWIWTQATTGRQPVRPSMYCGWESVLTHLATETKLNIFVNMSYIPVNMIKVRYLGLHKTVISWSVQFITGNHDSSDIALTNSISAGFVLCIVLHIDRMQLVMVTVTASFCTIICSFSSSSAALCSWHFGVFVGIVIKLIASSLVWLYYASEQ